jgi:hypothetical protein
LLHVDGVSSIRTLVLAALFTAAALPALAQTDAKFAIGYQVGLRSAVDQEAHGGYVSGFLWRFGVGDPGWGFHWGLNWYETHVDRSIVGQTVEFGELNVRPITAGYGYTFNYGKYSVTADILAGPALTSFSLTPGANDAYHDLMGARSVSSDVSWALVARPEASVWYDINKKLGLNVNVGFMFARPNVTIHSSLGNESMRVRADTLQIRAGLAYAIF